MPSKFLIFWMQFSYLISAHYSSTDIVSRGKNRADAAAKLAASVSPLFTLLQTTDTHTLIYNIKNKVLWVKQKSSQKNPLF